MPLRRTLDTRRYRELPPRFRQLGISFNFNPAGYDPPPLKLVPIWTCPRVGGVWGSVPRRTDIVRREDPLPQCGGDEDEGDGERHHGH